MHVNRISRELTLQQQHEENIFLIYYVVRANPPSVTFGNISE